MITFKHPLCNTVLSAAEADRNDVVDLHILRGVQEYPDIYGRTAKYHSVISFWRPSAQEIAQLVAGGSVALHCLALTAPPCYVGVEPVESETPT